MLVPVLHTLANLLAKGTSLTDTEQVDFSRPDAHLYDGSGPRLNLYLYDIRENKNLQRSGRRVERDIPQRSAHIARVSWSPDWYDVALVLTAWDRTVLSECQLLSEAMSVLLQHRILQEGSMTPSLRGHGGFALVVSSDPPIEAGALWSSLGVPLRPALYIRVTVPFEPRSTADIPRVWERIIGTRRSGNGIDLPAAIVARKVNIAGLVKSAATNRPIPGTKVEVLNTDKITACNDEGFFFFEDVLSGSYVLNLDCLGYVSQICNVLVEEGDRIYKEIRLTPL